MLKTQRDSRQYPARHCYSNTAGARARHFAPQRRRCHSRHGREVRRQSGHRHRLDDGADRHQPRSLRLRSATLALLRFRRRQRAVRLRVESFAPSITRKTDKGLPRYEDAEESDVFILSGAEDLVPVLSRTDGQWEHERSRRAPSTARRYRVSATARGSKDCSLASSAGPTPISRTRSGAPFPGTTSRHGMADRRKPHRRSRRSHANLQLADLRKPRRQGQRHRLRIQGRKLGRTSTYPKPTSGTAATTTRIANRYLKRIRYGNHAPYFPS